MELTDQHIYRHRNTGYVFQATHPTADVWMMGRIIILDDKLCEPPAGELLCYFQGAPDASWVKCFADENGEPARTELCILGLPLWEFEHVDTSIQSYLLLNKELDMILGG